MGKLVNDLVQRARVVEGQIKLFNDLCSNVNSS